MRLLMILLVGPLVVWAAINLADLVYASVVAQQPSPSPTPSASPLPETGISFIDILGNLWSSLAGGHFR